jgi:hypothetical protein
MLGLGIFWKDSRKKGFGRRTKQFMVDDIRKVLSQVDQSLILMVRH